ncbi:glyoxalase [Pedobacter jeongneungensis]|uniref:glyoxalase n=1 Tax=Pedobacter jeongneungensis TaxID=947309 RepID=UPI000469306B|nr:glyoxalase [Pedobacter jeongneungensis]
MDISIKSLRTFIGASDYNISRSFYTDLGFKETLIEKWLSLFQKEDLGFYLQDYYNKEWLENTMLFLTIDDANRVFSNLQSAGLESKYKNVKVSPVKKEIWGEVCFVHDPSGVLLHFAHLY